MAYSPDGLGDGPVVAKEVLNGAFVPPATIPPEVWKEVEELVSTTEQASGVMTAAHGVYSIDLKDQKVTVSGSDGSFATYVFGKDSVISVSPEQIKEASAAASFWNPDVTVAAASLLSSSKPSASVKFTNIQSLATNLPLCSSCYGESDSLKDGKCPVCRQTVGEQVTIWSSWEVEGRYWVRRYRIIWCWREGYPLLGEGGLGWNRDTQSSWYGDWAEAKKSLRRRRYSENHRKKFRLFEYWLKTDVHGQVGMEDRVPKWAAEPELLESLMKSA